MKLVRESQVVPLNVPGRKLQWLFHPDDGVAAKCSMNVVEIGAGQTVRPAHSHRAQEEVIYVVAGRGQVWVDGEIAELAEGTAVLFPVGSVHMVRNSGTAPLKLACFFAPPADFSAYDYHDGAGFPE